MFRRGVNGGDADVVADTVQDLGLAATGVAHRVGDQFRDDEGGGVEPARVAEAPVAEQSCHGMSRLGDGERSVG
jgi:hypothetical protein